MAKKKSGRHPAQDFMNAQNNVNTPWKYTTRGEPTPFDKAEGSPRAMAVWMWGVGVFLCIAAFAMFCTSFTTGRRGAVTLDWDSGLTIACLLITGMGVLLIRGGSHHWKRHEAQQAALKQKRQKQRKRKKR